MICKYLLVLFAFFIAFISSQASAGGKVTFLDISDGAVVFAINQPKTEASPSCMLVENADKWAISLNTEDGRATYTLLMTAMAAGMNIGAEPGGDCAGLAQYERPSRVWFEASSNSSATVASAFPILKLAPDLDFPAAKTSTGATVKTIRGLDTTEGLTSVVELTGKHQISFLSISGASKEDTYTIKLTIDGEVIWNAIHLADATTIILIGQSNRPESFVIEESMKLEIQATEDNSINLSYLARPVE